MSKKRHHALSEMHPSNPYFNNPPDFVALAEKYDSLKPFVTLKKSDSKCAAATSVRGSIDFRDPRALRELTYCLLQNDFDIILDIPLDSLCPAIPNRVNYVCWLEDLIGHMRPSVVTGIDIGTGASCIYPLLACVRNKTWKIVGTDISDASIVFATKNVAQNKLQNAITILKNNTPGIFPMELFEPNDKKYDFCMCNPPFYRDEQDIQESYDVKNELPTALCLGAENEMITEGGEVQFVSQMIQESLGLKHRIRWYTSMLGKRSSVDRIVARLKELKITNYLLTTFHQGRTGRWAVAWSFGDERPSWESTQQVSSKMAKLSAPKTVLSFETSQSPEQVLEATMAVLNELQLRYEQQLPQNQEKPLSNNSLWVLQVQTTKNTWSRTARRAAANQAKLGITAQNTNEPIVLQFDIRASLSTAQSSSSASTSFPLAPVESPEHLTGIHLAWTYGHDRNLFESFFLHFRSKITHACQAIV